MTRGWLFIAALGGLGCSDGPVATAWNGVFEVESLLRDPGCEVPTTETEPPLPFVGLGYGADVGIDLEVLTVFWCETPTQCITLPQANAWLDVATEEQVSGSFGEAELVAANVCAGLYNAIEATQTPNGRLTLDIVLANPEPVTVADEDECVAFLEDIAANQCDERLLIEARRAD